jgi:hypothetical protein
MALAGAQQASGMVGTIENMHRDTIGRESNGDQQGFLGKVLDFGNTANVHVFHFVQHGATRLYLGRCRQVPDGNVSIRSSHCHWSDIVLQGGMIRPKGDGRNADVISVVGFVTERKQFLIVTQIDQVNVP